MRPEEEGSFVACARRGHHGVHDEMQAALPRTAR